MLKLQLKEQITLLLLRLEGYLFIIFHTYSIQFIHTQIKVGILKGTSYYTHFTRKKLLFVPCIDNEKAKFNLLV